MSDHKLFDNKKFDVNITKISRHPGEKILVA